MNAEHSLNANADNSKKVLKLRVCSHNFWANFATLLLNHVQHKSVSVLISAYLFLEKCTMLLFKMVFLPADNYKLSELSNGLSQTEGISLEINTLINFLYGFLINNALYFTIIIHRNILVSSIYF